jgi:chromosome segregation ATPase
LRGTACFFAAGLFRFAAVLDFGLSRMIYSALLFQEAVSRVLAARAYQRRNRFGDRIGNLYFSERC